MKYLLKKAAAVIFIAIITLLHGCGLDAVENPNVTTDRYINSPQAANTWLSGARAELASGLGVIVELTELTSDNYFNNRTLSSKVFDIPQIVYTDIDVNRLQSAVQNIRRTAEFGLNTVLPGDDSSTAEHEAELYFYLGIAHLFAGEYFTGTPGSDNGSIINSEQHFDKALEAFKTVIEGSSTSEIVPAARLAMARISWHRNERTEVINQSSLVIDHSPNLNYQVEYDGVSGPNNSIQFFLYDSSQDEFAPLPRLDFLDPKYFSEDGAGQDQKPISLFKIEEAYLMLSEAQLASGNISGSKDVLIDLINDVISERPINVFDDSRETRSGGNRDDYPLEEDYLVRFSNGEPAIEGLILDRQAGPISVPGVSGTSVNINQIEELSTVEEVLEIIYLMRQEIFIAEGRRVVDLGIKYPISENEVRSNENIDMNHQAIQAQIPNFIPLGMAMNDFTNDDQNKIITIEYNMNKVLVENRTSEYILPLW